ncbi:hypothetical protein A5893_06460 [Pedobacter psychrophilus]|uniref:DUF5723 domain-containing protein n=1 Tax=Pedobacter psychrophilus TaxID=1826909 RepID=A0A179DIG2_9SPHI|nr:DUF5723 family protein [Pedobacter psychrophilus]OAQ40582.1 hypothetical protein A5893_06460 [Pedobacter psychrophilus]
MKKCLLLIFIIFSVFKISAQNFSLNHSGTLYDSFENPVEQSFQKDFSRKYAITILPSLFMFGNFEGEAQTAFKKYAFTRVFGASSFSDFSKKNNLIYDASLYLFSFKIFKTTNYNREIGISLKFKDEGNINISNGTFALLDDFSNFKQTNYSNILNSEGINQSYWQLALNYRENYNERWGFGAKISLLNGSLYNKLDINSSKLTIDSDTSYTAGLQGQYKSSFGTDNLSYSKLLPNLKNFGTAISAGASYTSKNGIYLSLNIRDLGFIHWSKKSSVYNFDDNFTVNGANRLGANNRFFSSFEKILNVSQSNENFYSLIDTKTTFTASKDFDFYQSTFVFNKSTFNKAGQIALVNNFKKNAFNISINPVYDLVSDWNLGSQFMIKSPNAEFYIGSDQVFPTYYFSKGFITKNENIGNGNPRLSFFIGLNMKFGKKMQDIGNADEIPGLNDKETGFVSRLSPRELRRAQKQNRAIEKRARKSDKRNRKN